MTRLVWGTVGERFYETGVDRGVLFVDSVGVAWNGLKAVKESPSGGDPRPFYIDGVKFLNISSAEEFAASIEAYSAPPEFAPCDGAKAVHAGLFMTQQPRKSFGLVYRTLIGNDIAGNDLGYKLHLVYNALARPASRENVSLNSSTEPTVLSWDITTTPPALTGFKPTAHVVIDSRTTPPLKLSAVEDLIYGTDIVSASLPTPQDLITLFGS